MSIQGHRCMLTSTREGGEGSVKRYRADSQAARASSASLRGFLGTSLKNRSKAARASEHFLRLSSTAARRRQAIAYLGSSVVAVRISFAPSSSLPASERHTP